jgi:hypothetical protein
VTPLVTDTGSRQYADICDGWRTRVPAVGVAGARRKECSARANLGDQRPSVRTMLVVCTHAPLTDAVSRVRRRKLRRQNDCSCIRNQAARAAGWCYACGAEFAGKRTASNCLHRIGRAPIATRPGHESAFIEQRWCSTRCTLLGSSGSAGSPDRTSIACAAVRANRRQGIPNWRRRQRRAAASSATAHHCKCDGTGAHLLDAEQWHRSDAEAVGRH